MKNFAGAVLLFLAFLPARAAAQNYEGQGGRGVRLAVAAPAGKNLIAGEAWLPRYVQGMFTANFNKFSAMTIIALQDRERIEAEQRLSLSGNFSDEDYIRIGEQTNAQLLLAGSVERTRDGRFSVQWSITELESGIIRCQFSKLCGFGELRNAAVINEASVVLLEQMGVRLTGAGKRELTALSQAAADARAAEAKGILAQQNGSAVEALSYFYLAASYDPSLAGNAERLGALSSQITGGGVGQNVRNAIAARKVWLAMLKDCADFYREHLPFDIVYDPALTQAGTTDYANATADFDFSVQLRPAEVAFKVINDLVSGLDATGKRALWDFNGWPLADGAKYPQPEAVMFGGNKNFRFEVQVRLIDAKGQTVGNDTIILNSSLAAFKSGDKRLDIPQISTARPLFKKVSIKNYTSPLSVKLVSINGLSAESLNESGFMRVLTLTEYATETRAR